MIQEATIKQTLFASIANVFETMLFMSYEENSDNTVDVKQNCTLGSISFKGEKIEGNMNMICTSKDAKFLATSMLGMDVDDDMEPSEINDAIGEICNMLMGNIKTELIKDYGEFQICIPQVTTGCDIHNKVCGSGDMMEVDIVVDDMLPIKFTMMCRT